MKEKIKELFSVACYGDLNAVAELREYLLATSGIELLKFNVRMYDYGSVLVHKDFSEDSTHPFVVALDLLGMEVRIAL